MTNLHYVKAMSARRQSYQEPSRVSHISADGRLTLCGLVVTRSTNKGVGLDCKRCRAALARTCHCMTEPDEHGVERVVQHSAGCPEFLGY